MESKHIQKLAKILGSSTTFKLKRDQEYGEYEVEVYEDGVKNPERSYFTDGFEDANETMEAMAEEQILREVMEYKV